MPGAQTATTPPPPLLRASLGQVAADSQLALAVTAGHAVVVTAGAAAAAQATWLDARGTTIQRDGLPAAVAGPQPLASPALTAVWTGQRDGTSVARLALQTTPLLRKLPQPLVGLAGQANGDTIAVVQGESGAQAVRLDPAGLPRWDRPLDLPGAATAVTATLRDDVLVLGRSVGKSPSWFAARVAQADGKLLWLRVLPAGPAGLPPDLEWGAASTAPRGAALLISLARGGSVRSAEPWTLVELDANGQVGWRTPWPRTAAVAVLAGDGQRILAAQARSGGVLVASWGGAGQSAGEWTAGWRGLEIPHALGSGSSGEIWCASLAPHADGKTATALVTRWSLGRPARPAPCEPSPCAATRADPDACATIQLPDGTPCSPLSQCRGGVCGGVRPGNAGAAQLPTAATE